MFKIGSNMRGAPSLCYARLKLPTGPCATMSWLGQCLMSDNDRWEPWHRQQIEAILQIAAAVERQRWGGEATDIEPLEFDRIVTEDGQPGAGVAKDSRIIRES